MHRLHRSRFRRTATDRITRRLAAVLGLLMLTASTLAVTQAPAASALPPSRPLQVGYQLVQASSGKCAQQVGDSLDLFPCMAPGNPNMPFQLFDFPSAPLTPNSFYIRSLGVPGCAVGQGSIALYYVAVYNCPPATVANAKATWIPKSATDVHHSWTNLEELRNLDTMNGSNADNTLLVVNPPAAVPSQYWEPRAVFLW